MLATAAVGSFRSGFPPCQPSMPNPVDSVLDRLAGWLLPPRCVLCGAPGQRPVLDLCADCEADLPRQDSACPRCALALPAGSPVGECAQCRVDPPPWDRCLAPWRYDFPLAGLIQELKYAGRLPVARVLGTLLARRAAAADLHHDVDLLLPVPLHPAKLVERGFNQSIEIAHWLARGTRRTLVVRGLRRTRETRPQVGLDLHERAANLRAAFDVTADFAGRRVAIVDDVMTTGSTVREIAGVLRRGRAARIDVWCVARAQRVAGTLGASQEERADA